MIVWRLAGKVLGHFTFILIQNRGTQNQSKSIKINENHMPSTFLSQSHQIFCEWQHPLSFFGSPIFTSVRPRSATSAKPAGTWTVLRLVSKNVQKYPYFQWISIDYTFSPIQKMAFFLAVWRVTAKNFQRKPYFLWDSMAFIGIKWPFLISWDGW